MRKLLGCFFVALVALCTCALPALAFASDVGGLFDPNAPWYVEAGSYYILITSVIGTAAMLATMTPTPKDDEFIAKVIKVLNWVGMNFGFAKNKK